MIAKTFVALGMFVAVTASCGGTKPQVETTSAASAASVAHYKTYSIEVATSAPKGYTLAKRSKVVLDMARPKIDAEMTKKGYVAKAGNDADLVVHVAAGVKLGTEEPSSGELRAGVDTDVDEVSTLAVTIHDRKTNESLFSGSASKEIHSKTVKEADVSFAVTEILEPIPASAGK